MAAFIPPNTQNPAETIQWLQKQSALADAQCMTALGSTLSFAIQLREKNSSATAAKFEALIAENALALRQYREINAKIGEVLGVACNSQSIALSPTLPPQQPVEKNSPTTTASPTTVTSPPSRWVRGTEAAPMPFLRLPNTSFSDTRAPLAGRSLTKNFSQEHQS